MVIKMGGDSTRNFFSRFIFQPSFIGGILEWREIVDIHIPGTDHDTGGMLPCGPFYPCHAGR